MLLGRPRGSRSRVMASVWLLLVLHSVYGQEAATHSWSVKVLQRLLVPLRSNPFSQSTVSPCALGLATCFLPSSDVSPQFGFGQAVGDYDRRVMLELRTDYRGPAAHHWLELEGPEGKMTIGFGPATLPFLDSGQISLQDRYGNIERISGMHPLPWLGLPPFHYHYAPRPEQGRIIGNPILLTTAQSEFLVRNLEHRKFVGPYIPFFHDCRTFTCSVLASAQGHSTLPCYLLFKGYW